MNFKLSCYVTLSVSDGEHLSDAMNLLSAVFIEMMLCAFKRPSAPALKRPVPIVVPCCTNKQMLWPNTRRVVAFVQNPKFFRYNAITHDPRCSMGDKGTGVAYAECPIASPVFSGSPFPTLSEFWNMFWNRAVFVHFRPESFVNFLRGEIFSGKRWLHSVSRLIVCRALDCLVTVREQFCLSWRSGLSFSR